MLFVIKSELIFFILNFSEPPKRTASKKVFWKLFYIRGIKYYLRKFIYSVRFPSPLLCLAQYFIKKL